MGGNITLRLLVVPKDIKAGKTVEYYTYDGADHNISSPNFEAAVQRSLAFFDKYLK